MGGVVADSSTVLSSLLRSNSLLAPLQLAATVLLVYHNKINQSEARPCDSSLTALSLPTWHYLGAEGLMIKHNYITRNGANPAGLRYLGACEPQEVHRLFLAVAL